MSKQHINANPVFVIAGLILILLVAGFYHSVCIVEPGNVGVVIRLGEAQPNALEEGIHLVVPFVTTIKPLDIKIKKAEVKTAAASKDLQTVNAEIVVNYRIDKTNAIKLFRDIGINYLSIVIEPQIQESFKAGAAKYTAEALITERSDVSAGIRESISSRMQQFGVIIDAVNITNFDFSQEFNKAIEEKMTAEQRALQAENELERYKFEARQKVETARGEAEAVMERAKAEAEALNLKKQYVTLELIWLSAVEKWDGQLPTHLFAAPPIPVFNTNSDNSVTYPITNSAADFNINSNTDTNTNNNAQ
ncbi:MAG: prohibitin family protein [Planctomycetaceae bacterium]|jgi:regulator of protease activity HflC (stomatin/prohibitin superfamily)|nr:prohibitin family protein [Planctomycetaceae bacterium]